MAHLETVEEHRCFGGRVGFYRHRSGACSCEMSFSVYLPPQAGEGPVPVLYYLAGLTCTEETFQIKGGAQRYAAEHGIMLVAPDTSPRGEGVPDKEEEWDFGTGAGFYIDATREPWSAHYNMKTYVTEELRELILDNFPARPDAQGVFGHSMGGHGALVLALENPDLYRSVSAFAPICHPSEVPWGRKAFGNYLSDESEWAGHDATELVRRGRTFDGTILIDQGLDDPFLGEQLSPEAFESACEDAGQSLKLRRHPGYDHSYYFISTFMEDHIGHHADRLCRE
jgi:S-formylglutathione hydrolase